MVSRRTVIKLLATLGAIPILGYVYSNRIETNIFTITRLDFNIGLNFRIIHISDTHFGSSIYDVNSLVKLIRELDPDIIFHTGDLITTMDGLGMGVSFMNRLSDISPVYIVAGNHDHWSGLGSDGMKEKLGSFENIYVLNNEAVRYRGIWIIRVDDPYTYHDDLSKALESVSGDGLKILLAHSPQIIGKVHNDIDLILAGHTHGGQIRIPFIGPLWVPLPREYRRYDYGLFEVDGLRMFVTRGIGTTFYPIRFNCPPEVLLLNL